MTVIDEVPVRPDDLQLIGEMPGSGYRVAPALVRRGDGQTLQLTPLLYAVLEATDGTRTCEQIAHAVSERIGKPVSAANVRTLVDELERQYNSFGLVTMCTCGGMGTATIIERI